MQDNQLVEVWNVNSTDGLIRVATIEQGPRVSSMCDGCPAPCCQGILRPILTSEEFLSKKFPTRFMDVPGWLKRKTLRAEKIATLAFTDSSSCNYFDSVSHRCTIWPDCPKACLAYDCREDPRMRAFAKARGRNDNLPAL